MLIKLEASNTTKSKYKGKNPKSTKTSTFKIILQGLSKGQEGINSTAFGLNNNHKFLALLKKINKSTYRLFQKNFNVGFMPNTTIPGGDAKLPTKKNTN